ncbi:MBOAT family O-acyltransferase [Bdellovibrio sp. BCCA]|uniref:MBOAT family O-acyltransferase n=1 Tax=Bdellovibrio sp. BCCA TaxID=3136281 RepID=UPI0030F10029
MSFTSFAFFIFIGVFFSIWYFLRNRREGRWFLLTVASFFFYGWWDWKFLGLLIATGLFDFILALTIDRTKGDNKRLILMCFSVISNLTVLALFKYTVFFSNNFEELGQYFGWNVSLTSNIPSVFLVLPIGISFYTFESLSYTIDVYHRHIKPTKNVFQYFAFLSMFPRLVAGPIERPANLLPQLERNPQPSNEMVWKGFNLILAGYFKKLVIADNLAPYVNEAFARTHSVSGLSWWIAMFSFSIQIYCDFSGYSDIARGLANLLGFEFKLNFNSPYISHGFSDFWRRWHISLSSWFRDYLYIPLGGSKVSKIRSHLNTWITMLVSGFWHGASWTFVAWGALHAMFLSFEHEVRWHQKINKHLVVLITFLMVTFAWVLFRAESLQQAKNIYLAMLTLSGGDNLISLKQIFLILLALVPHLYEFSKSKTAIEQYYPTRLVKIVMATMIVFCIFGRGPGSTFIYFQF